MGAVVLSDINKYYAGTMACADISLSIKHGEFFTFLGPSGCGKTTILRLIAGFIQPDRGTIHLGDQEITHLAAEKRQVGMVFQNYALFPFMTVYENIAYGLKIQKTAKKELIEKVARYIEMVGLGDLQQRNISELSGGEQQRVALARSLATEPHVLLLDEPLSNLDARLRHRMRFELKSLQKKLGITTIFVTHDQSEALTMSDRIAVFAHGRCMQVGTPEEIYSQPGNSFVARFIGDTNLFAAPCHEGKASVSETLVLRVDSELQGEFISIRPQDIDMAKTAGGHENTFAGKVEDIQFNGISVEYTINVQGIHFQVTTLNTTVSRHTIRSSDSVYLTFPRENIRVLDR